MFRNSLIIMVFMLSFFSCEKVQRSKVRKKEISISSPVRIIASSPVLINTDSRPKPHTIIIPVSLTNQFITLKNGQQINLTPPKINVASFFSSMGNYNTEQGLALNSVFCSFEDQTGNIWFGTYGGGVSRYDGKSFANYSTANGLSDNTVVDIIEDKSGSIWFATDGGGVCRYDGKSFTSYSTENGLADNTIKKIIVDTRGNIWFIAATGGVSRYDGKSLCTYSTAEGLAGKEVLCITEDRAGNIWFGTQEGGVSRYDGNRVEASERGEMISQKLQQDIKKINGKLIKSFTNFNVDQGLAGNSVNSIIEDKTGNMWFGTSAKGVSCYNGKSFTNYTTAFGLAGNSISCIIEDKMKNIWFGTISNGVSRYDGKSFINYNTAQGLANNTVTSITEDKRGNLWFINKGNGVSCYDIGQSSFGGVSEIVGKFTSFTTSQGLASNNVSKIMEDRMGNLWFSTLENGVSRYDGNAFISYTTAQGLANNSVRGVLEDKTGNLWFATTGGGVCSYDGKSFTTFTTAQGLADNTVWAVCRDIKDNLWFGTSDNGVSCYDGKSFTNYTTEQGLAHNTVWSITEDTKKNVWFGTNGGGVSCYDGKCFINFTTTQGLANNTVWNIFEDEKKNMWFATSGGVSCYDGKLFTNFTTAQGLTNNNVRSIIQDNSGNFWFGTDGGGISRYDGKSIMNFTTANGLADDVVYDIVEDNQGVIWVGTNLGFSGLCFFNKKTGIENVEENKNTQPTKNKAGFNLNSRKEKIKGNNSFSNEELKANYQPVFEIYNFKKGYPVKDVNTNAMLVDSKGIIWAGTGDKLVRFDYSKINRKLEPPKIFIQGLKINSENICWSDLLVNKNLKFSNDSLTNTNNGFSSFPVGIPEEVTTFGRVLTEQELDIMHKKFKDIEFDSIASFYPIPYNLILPYKNNNITFDFAAIETAQPNLLRYQYMLEGYDNEYSTLTDKTSVSFGNIHEGKYTFRLKAISNNGIWSKTITYTFKVLPPFYRTWWMYLTYLAIGLLFIGLFIRWREKNLKFEKIILENIVKQRTKQLEEKNKIVEEQKKEVTDKNSKITASINYAQQIQQAILPSEQLIKLNLPETFIFFKPKDIVSGDFYFFKEFENYILLACVDCTGHGVPGGFMSTLGSLLLDKIANDESSLPSEILSKLSDEIVKVLHQVKGGEIQDGMDLSICLIDRHNRIIKFSGARNGIIIVTNDQSKRYKANPLPVGGNYLKNGIPIERNFKTQSISINTNDWIYMYTDGFMEQVGGTEGIPMNYTQFETVLINVSKKQNKEEKNKLLQSELDNWRGGHERDDDVLIIGFQVV